MSGNGVDIAAVYQLLREVADRVIAHDGRFAAIDGVCCNGWRFSAIDRQFTEVRSDIADLRHTLTQYHARARPRHPDQRPGAARAPDRGTPALAAGRRYLTASRVASATSPPNADNPVGNHPLDPAQIEALAIIAGMLVLFVSDRLRYDLVAALALSAAVLTGVVPAKKAFEGFASPVIIIIASVLVISRAVAVSGVIDNAMRRADAGARFHHAAGCRAHRRGELPVRLRQERRRPRRLHAGGDPGRRTAQPSGVALPDAARLRFTDRRHHHPDRHLAQRADLGGAPGGHGPAVSPVRLHARSACR